MAKESVIVKSNGRKADATPAAMLMQVASQYESGTYVGDAGERVNTKDIMDMTTLGLVNSLEIVVTTDGKDKDAVVTGVEEYLCQ